MARRCQARQVAISSSDEPISLTWRSVGHIIDRLTARRLNGLDCSPACLARVICTCRRHLPALPSPPLSLCPRAPTSLRTTTHFVSQTPDASHKPKASTSTDSLRQMDARPQALSLCEAWSPQCVCKVIERPTPLPCRSLHSVARTSQRHPVRKPTSLARCEAVALSSTATPGHATVIVCPTKSPAPSHQPLSLAALNPAFTSH